jgi:hypothetical protein
VDAGGPAKGGRGGQSGRCGRGADRRCACSDGPGLPAACSSAAVFVPASHVTTADYLTPAAVGLTVRTTTHNDALPADNRWGASLRAGYNGSIVGGSGERGGSDAGPATMERIADALTSIVQRLPPP